MPFIAYLAALLIAASGLALGLDFMTRPPTQTAAHKPTAQMARAAPDPVRQIPIGRAGDPDGQLSPVYPANPGKNLPAPDSADTQKTETAPVAAQVETSGSGSGGVAAASAPREPVAAVAPVAAPQPAAADLRSTAAAAPASCNAQACASAYKSFRASDCSYQPFDGPRKLCEGAPASGEQIASQPQRRAIPSTRDDGELDDVVRTVRRLPNPSTLGDEGSDSIAVIERPDGSRGGWQRRWVIEGR